MNSFCCSLLLLPLLLLSFTAHAQHTAVNTAGASRLTGAIFILETDYDGPGTSKPSVEGELLSVAYKASINSQFSLGAGLGYLLDGDYSGNGDGKGFRLFGEGDYTFLRSGSSEFLGTFGLIYDNFDFDELREYNFRMLDLRVGGLMLHKIRAVSLYAGLDVFLYSKGALEVRDLRGLPDAELERDDRLGLRLGLAFAASKRLDLRGEIHLIGQQSVLLGIDYQI